MADPLWEGVREGCGSCAFGKREVFAANGKDLVSVLCRRKPPVMVPVTTKDAWANTVVVVEPHQPRMVEDDWCGEYKRKGTA